MTESNAGYARDLPVALTSAVTDHDASDGAGDMLGPASDGFWRDHKSAKVNAIRTRTLIEQCDMAVVLRRKNTSSGTPPSTPARQPLASPM
ncbi:MAG: YtoQ family protein [Burkholderiaceae bacterium]